VNNRQKHIRYFIVNLLLVTILSTLIIYLNNGVGNNFPFKYLGIAILVSLPIIYFQYPILQLKQSWIYKSLIFYGAMLVFLFVYSVLILLLDKGLAGESILSALSAGLAMTIIGQISTLIVGFLPILAINYFLRNKLF